MAYKIIEVPDEEMLNEEYRCECGGAVVEGLQHPNGDYDDWICQPYCIKCKKTSWSSKNPYCDFIPIVHEPCTIGAYFVTFDNGEKTVLTYNIKFPPQTPQNLVSWGMGGTMWNGATWQKVTNTISRPEGVSDDKWDDMINEYVKGIKSAGLCQVCGQTKVAFTWEGTRMCPGCSMQTGHM